MSTPRTPYTLRKQGQWVAHAVAFDLVATDDNRDDAISQLRMCLIAQVGWGLKHGKSVLDCYFAAPSRYWEPPFEFMEMPTDAEIAEMKFEEPEGVAAPLEPTKLELGFMRSEIKMAIPRLRQDDIEWLIANFRSSAEAYAAAVSKNLQEERDRLLLAKDCDKCGEEITPTGYRLCGKCTSGLERTLNE